MHPNEQLLWDYAASWSTRDVDHILSFFHEDALWEDGPFAVSARGHAAIREFIVYTLDSGPDFKLTYARCFATDRYGAAEFSATKTWQGTVRGTQIDVTGVPSEAIGASLFEFRDGKIVRDTDHYDYSAYLQNLGVLPKDLSQVMTAPVAEHSHSSGGM